MKTTILNSRTTYEYPKMYERCWCCTWMMMAVHGLCKVYAHKKHTLASYSVKNLSQWSWFFSELNQAFCCVVKTTGRPCLWHHKFCLKPYYMLRHRRKRHEVSCMATPLMMSQNGWQVAIMTRVTSNATTYYSLIKLKIKTWSTYIVTYFRCYPIRNMYMSVLRKKVLM